MKQNKKTTIIIVTLFIAFASFAVGFGKGPAVLNIQNLIDLDKAVETALLGVDTIGEEDGQIESQDVEEKTDEEQDQIEETEQGQSNETLETSKEKTVTKLVVVIHGKEIQMNKRPFSSAEELLLYIKQEYKSPISIYLMEDYAEAHVFHEVDKTLRNFCDEAGYDYDAD